MEGNSNGGINMVETLKKLLKMDEEFAEVDISKILNDTYRESIKALSNGGFTTLNKNRITQADIVRDKVLGLIVAINFVTDSVKSVISSRYQTVSLTFDDDLTHSPASCILYALFYSESVSEENIFGEEQFTLELYCPREAVENAKEMAKVLAILYADVWYDISVYSYDYKGRIVN